jgi:hypothetical protein
VTEHAHLAGTFTDDQFRRRMYVRWAIGGVFSGFFTLLTVISAGGGLYGRRVEHFVHQFGGDK